LEELLSWGIIFHLRASATSKFFKHLIYIRRLRQKYHASAFFASVQKQKQKKRIGSTVAQGESRSFAFCFWLLVYGGELEVFLWTEHHTLQVVSFAREGATSIPEIETRLTALGRNVGVSLLELIALRDKSSKREVWSCILSFQPCDVLSPVVRLTVLSHLSISLPCQVRLVPMLTFISQTLWKSLFGKVLLYVRQAIHIQFFFSSIVFLTQQCAHLICPIQFLHPRLLTVLKNMQPMKTSAFALIKGFLVQFFSVTRVEPFLRARYMINEKECVTNRFISVPADHGVCSCLEIFCTS
jgi:hypothetical protein